jgi:hypothetical protein
MDVTMSKPANNLTASNKHLPFGWSFACSLGSNSKVTGPFFSASLAAAFKASPAQSIAPCSEQMQGRRAIAANWKSL